MRRQLLVNGSLLVLALGSLGVVWATRDRPTTSELAARKNKLFPEWNKEQVTRLTLTRSGVKLELHRTPDTGVDGDFRIVSPWPERADIATVSALLGSLDLATALRAAPEVADARSGLSKPTLEIRLEMSGKSLDLALGEAAPAPAGARYARVRAAGSADQTYVVSQGLVSELDVPFDKFREPRLLDYGRSEIRELSLDSELGRVRLTQRDGVFLVDTQTGPELAERGRSDRMLTALARLATEHFVDVAEARAALPHDAVKIVLRLTAGPDVTLALGGTCPALPEQSLALREQPEHGAKAGCVPRDLVEAFRVTPADLVASTAFGARLDEVEELQLAEGARTLDLARKERGFVMRKPRPSEVTLDAGNQLISALLSAKGQRLVAPRLAELGLEAPLGKVTLQLAAGEGAARSERVQVGNVRADGSLCVQRDADKVVLCVDSVAAQAFRPDTAVVQPLDLLSVAPSEMTAIAVDVPGLHQRVVRDADGSYSLTEPAGFKHDGALVADLAQALGTLRAVRWISAEDDGSHGFAAPRLRAKLELAKGALPRELVVGARASDGYFGQLLPDPAVFVLARSDVEELEQPLIDRSLCPVDEPSLARIELSQGNRRLALTRAGEQWSSDELEPSRAQTLAETLIALRAEQTLHLGATKPNEGLSRPSLVVGYVDAQGKRRQVSVGAGTTVRSDELAFARRDDVDATFGLALETLRALQDF
jgi:hypothetical protein